MPKELRTPPVIPFPPTALKWLNELQESVVALQQKVKDLERDRSERLFLD